MATTEERIQDNGKEYIVVTQTDDKDPIIDENIDNDTAFSSRFIPHNDEEYLSMHELSSLTISAEQNKSYIKDKENIKLKLQIVECQIELMKSKQETLERDKLILEYHIIQNTINHEEFKTINKQLLEGISSNHPTIKGNWSYEPKSGRIIQNKQDDIPDNTKQS